MSEILIVDDDIQIRKLLRTFFERAGFTVREAENGRLALDQYGKKPSDVVILDVLMPDMEGVETIRRLKEMDPAVAVIALSGGGRMSGEYYLQMIKSFVPRYSFTKPVDLKIILDAVREILDSKQVKG